MLVRKNTFLCMFLMLIVQEEQVIADEYHLMMEKSYLPYQLDTVRDKAKLIAVKGKELNLNPKSPMTFTNLGSGDIYYALYDDTQIRSFNLSNNDYLGGWNLVMYPEVTLEPELANLGVQSRYEYSGGELGAGCLLAYPLRYSDVNLDGKKELILFLGRGSQVEWIIFSTDLKKVIFSSTLAVDHAFIPDDEDISKSYQNYGKPDDYQYLSDWVEGNPPPLEKGFRSFGKLFFGDLNGDGTFDIILWRKYFESRKRNDELKGFIKKDELLVHYTFTDGQYKKQSTDSATIKSWLNAKNLTWQKGYPSQSECAGKEGQFIPEMHDPLLNDPDVLK